MIYVIASAAFKEDSLTEYETIIKIGYTEDNKSEKRFSNYQTHNPTHKILFKIKDGTEDDESGIHHYFEKYRLSYNGRFTKEWFKYDNEILEFFKTHPTIEDIRRDVTEYIGIKKRDSAYRLRYIIRPYIISIESVTGKFDETIYEGCRSATKEYAESWIKQHYVDKANEILDHYNKIQSLITSKMSEFIDRLRDITTGNISERLRMLVESKEFTDDEKKMIAQQVSEKFDQYYNLVGPDRCRALGFNVTYIKNEVDKLKISKNDIKDEFLKYFEVNKRYTNKDIKDTIKKIYDTLGYTRNAKATDINEYFETKHIQVIMPDKSKIHGLEIVSIK